MTKTNKITVVIEIACTQTCSFADAESQTHRQTNEKNTYFNLIENWWMRKACSVNHRLGGIKWMNEWENLYSALKSLQMYA